MLKQIITLGIILLCVNIAYAGEIVTEDNYKVNIYGEVEDFIYMSSVNDNERNFNRTVCINATVVEGEISICGADEYELEYNFIADINDSSYVSRILVIKQEIKSSSLLSGKILNRTLILDGVTIGNYESKTSYWGKTKKNTVYFDLLDSNIRFGSNIIINESLAFTQLNYVDQQEYLPNVSKQYPKFPIYHKYRSVGYDGEGSLKLTGLTGILYNVFGSNIFTKIPFVGDNILRVGLAIQSIIYLPLTIIQFVFNFIFSFLILIINNWWYALMLIEIICIIPTFKCEDFSDRVGKYFVIHMIIFRFMYEVIILKIINLLLRLIEIIRNMFRI